jgi:hypothetical protein
MRKNTAVLVPEASMHENYFSLAGKYQIWLSRQVWPMKPVAVSHAMNQAPDEQFRMGVLGTHATHPLASLRGS